MRSLLAASALALATAQALSQDDAVPQSVSDLLYFYGFEAKGVIPSNAGPGILLQGADAKGKQVLIMCFVAETPDSETIATQYCKKVE